MSSVANYSITGLKLEAGVFHKMHPSKDDLHRIQVLETLEDDEITVAQMQEIQKLKNGSRSIKYNGVRICSEDEQDCAIVYNKARNIISIAGYDGNDLILHLNQERDFFEIRAGVGYLDDNYDNHMGPLLEIIEAFRATCTITLDSQEGDSSENGTVVYMYKDGQEVSDV